MGELIDYRKRLVAHAISEAEKEGRNLIGRQFAALHLKLIRLEKKLKENYSAAYDVEIKQELLDMEGGK